MLVDQTSNCSNHRQFNNSRNTKAQKTIRIIRKQLNTEHIKRYCKVLENFFDIGQTQNLFEEYESNYCSHDADDWSE